MITKTKPFSNGRSKAIRIPKAFDLPDHELTLVKVGNAIIVRPSGNTTNTLSETASALADAFDGFVREQKPPREIAL